jgi:hypothetical protein
VGPAVDRQAHAGDEARLLRAEERDDAPEVVGVAEAACGDAGGPLLDTARARGPRPAP